MAQLRASSLEKRAESFVERRYHAGKNEPKAHRKAGELFGLDLKEKKDKQRARQRQDAQKQRPTGVGFGMKDDYGPDNSWDTQDPLTHTPSPSYYRNYRSY